VEQDLALAPRRGGRVQSVRCHHGNVLHDVAVNEEDAVRRQGPRTPRGTGAPSPGCHRRRQEEEDGVGAGELDLGASDLGETEPTRASARV
jgi:hypothetical protein